MTTALDKFEEYIHHAIQACTGKEAGKILKNEIKTLKEEKNKLKRDTGEKEVLVDGQTGKLHNYMNKGPNKCWKQKLYKRENINFGKMYQ